MGGCCFSRGSEFHVGRAIKPKPYKTYVAKTGEIDQKWYILDAADQSLGRISAAIAMRLMGKDKPTYTPHIDTGDFVVVINAAKVSIQPRNLEGRTYRKWSGFPGGLRVRTVAQQQGKNATTVVTESVRRMLPKTMLGKVMLSKVESVLNDKHPHAAQKPEAWSPLN